MTAAQLQDVFLSRLRDTVREALRDHPDADRLTVLWAIADLEGEADDLVSEAQKEAAA